MICSISCRVVSLMGCTYLIVSAVCALLVLRFFSFLGAGSVGKWTALRAALRFATSFGCESAMGRGCSLGTILLLAFFSFSLIGANAIRGCSIGSTGLFFRGCRERGGNDRALTTSSSCSGYPSVGAIDATDSSRPGRFDRDLDLDPTSTVVVDSLRRCVLAAFLDIDRPRWVDPLLGSGGGCSVCIEADRPR